MKSVLLAAWLVSPLAAQVIAGGVVNRTTGKPVAQVRLRLRGKTDRFAVTDSGGRFQFTGVQPDRYSLLGVRAGFLGEVRTVTLPEGATLQDLRFPIIPQAVISGRVLDADGWPVRGATVQAFRAGENGEEPEATAGVNHTDDLGQFRVAGLSAGRYYLRISPYDLRNWDRRYANATYPAPSGPPLAVRTGRELGGLKIRLSNPDGVTVQGRIAKPPGLRVPSGTALFPTLVSDRSGDRYACVVCRPDGVFAFRNVVPGSYWLQIPGPPDTQGDQGYWAAAFMKVEVASADLSGVELKLPPEDFHDLAGSVVSNDPSGRAPAGLVLMRLDLPRPQGVNRAATAADGSFLMARTPAGRYRIEVATASLQGPWPWGIVARLGQTDLPGGEFTFNGAPIPLNLRLVPSTASLTVQAAGARNRPVWDAVVHIEPVNPALRVKAGGATDQNGSYQGWLPPGEYRVWVGPEGAGTAPAQTVRLAAGANPPLRFVLAARTTF